MTNIGGGTLTGSVSGVSAPFIILSGGSYSLSANQWQAVEVQYCPTVPGTHTQNVNFTGGGGATGSVTGTGRNLSLTLAAKPGDGGYLSAAPPPGADGKYAWGTVEW